MATTDMRYSAGQLVRYHRHCTLCLSVGKPKSRVLPPGGRVHFDDMTAAEWLRWFGQCLTRKISRGSEANGKGNRAAKRAWRIRKSSVRCAWCGGHVGSKANPNASHNFCDAECAKAYFG